MRRLLPCFAALALLVGACGGDDDTATTPDTEVTPTTDGDADTSTTTSTTTDASTSTSTTTGGDGSAVALERSCQSPDGFAISYPSDWQAVSDCGQFGPGPLDEPAPSTDERTGVVSAFIDEVAFEQVSEPTEGDTSREETTVAGHPAVRVAGEQSGVGLYPEGTAYVRWMVDLSQVRGPATLFVDAYDLGYDIDFEQAVQVLDSMVQTVQVRGG